VKITERRSGREFDSHLRHSIFLIGVAMAKIFKGCPDDMKELASLCEKASGLTRKEIRDSVTCYSLGEVSVEFIGQTIRIPDNRAYLYFPKAKNSVSIPVTSADIYELCVPLKMDDYGFGETIIKYNATKIDVKLSEEAGEVYDNIIKSKEMAGDELMNSVGFMINESMEYDSAKLMAPFLLHGRSVDEKMFIGDYEPTGKEVMKGICMDAGRVIRKVLRNLNMEKTKKILDVESISGGLWSHDTTTVFDTETGNWAVINSKSPVKKYNLVPKEKLSELGRPYVPIQADDLF
jgi:hypothetical protein